MPGLNRFAISALSKARKAEALNQEIMIDKKTGEFLIKDIDGNIVSYDSISRIKNHIDDLTMRAHLLNVAGTMYKFTIDGLSFPSVILEDTELIPAPIILHEGEISKLLLSIDLDKLKIENGELDLHETSCEVEYDMTIMENETTTTVYNKYGTVDLYDLLMTPLTIKYPLSNPGDVVNYKIILNSLKVRRNTLDDIGDNFRFILNDILMVTK